MLIYPQIDPVAFHLGPLAVHWYGIMYLIGFASAWGLLILRAGKNTNTWKREYISDLIFYGAIGVIIGGRLGYMLFYNFPELVQSPLSLFKIWQGGMSFHGGLTGAILALWLYGKKRGQSLFSTMDFVAPVAPIGLGAGRIGNFINGELWGRVTDQPWGMIYPDAGLQPRHPSEIYEFLLEGVLFFIIIWWFSSKPRPKMAVSGLFLLLYGCFRFFCEFFRQPDSQLGFIAWDWLTMGQLLSVPMIFLGTILLIISYKKAVKTA